MHYFNNSDCLTVACKTEGEWAFKNICTYLLSIFFVVIRAASLNLK